MPKINVKNILPQDYIKYFRTDGLIGCMHSELLMQGPLGKNMLVMNRNKVYYSYMSKKLESFRAQQGLELYGDKEKFEKYVQEFKDYIKQAKAGVIKQYKKPPKKLSKEEFIKIRKFVGILWEKYGFLEASFQELAHSISIKDKNKVLQDNLAYAGKFKFEAREIMIDYYFRGGVLENIYKYFSKKYDVDAAYLYTDELLGLFEGKRPREDYQERKECYAAMNHKGKLVKFSYKEAQKLCDEFAERVEKNFVQGMTANMGKATGRVVIAPMFDNQEAVMRINEKMKKGDILIAETTSPELMVLCKKAAAIVTNTGGMLSHAAIVSRELKIPCVVNTFNATRAFKFGDIVEVDADKGIVKKIK